VTLNHLAKYSVTRSIVTTAELFVTARRVCIARTMLWQDVRVSVRLSHAQYSADTAKHNIKHIL